MQQEAELAMYDEAVAYGDLLVAGEAVAVLAPGVRCLTAGSNAPSVQLRSDAPHWGVVVVPAPAAAAITEAAAAAAVVAAASALIRQASAATPGAGSSIGSAGSAAGALLNGTSVPGAVGDSSAAGPAPPAPGGQQLLGVIASEPCCSASGWGQRRVTFALLCCGAMVHVTMEVGGTMARLLPRIAAGQAVYLTGVAIREEPADAEAPDMCAAPMGAGATTAQPATPASGSGRRLAADWRDSAPGARFVNLSCLPALLCSPAVQRRIPLGAACNATANASGAAGATGEGPAAALPPSPPPAAAAAALAAALASGEPCICSGRVVALEVGVSKAHRACGRGVSRVSFGLGGMFDDDECDGGDGNDECADGISGDEGGGCLWQCGFCGVECGGDDVVPSYHGRVTLQQPSSSSAACCDAEGAFCAGSGAAIGSNGASSSNDSSSTAGGSILVVEMDDHAAAGLLGLPADAFKALPPSEQSCRLDAARGGEATLSLYLSSQGIVCAAAAALAAQ